MEKNIFYETYFSNHILPRKGDVTKSSIQIKSRIWDKTFSEFLPKDKSSAILDLGCGEGSIVYWLHKKGFLNSKGIDISLEQINVGKRLGIKNISQCEMTEFLENNQNYYDVIFARDLLEHFEKDQILKILRLIFKSLKKNSSLIIQVPNGESPFGNRVRYGDFTHEIAFTSGSLSQILKVTGFEKINFYPTKPPVLGIKSFFRYVLWKMVEKFYKLLLFAEVGSTSKVVSQNIIAVAKKD